MKNSQLKCHWPWFDLSMSSKVKLYQVNWKAIHDLQYVCHTNCDLLRCTVSEILAEIHQKGSNRKKVQIGKRSKSEKGPNRTFLTLLMTIRVIPYLSYFRTGLVCFTTQKLHDAINWDSTSLLLNNINNYGKMGQTWPFQPWQLPCE